MGNLIRAFLKGALASGEGMAKAAVTQQQQEELDRIRREANNFRMQQLLEAHQYHQGMLENTKKEKPIMVQTKWGLLPQQTAEALGKEELILKMKADQPEVSKPKWSFNKELGGWYDENSPTPPQLHKAEGYTPTQQQFAERDKIVNIARQMAGKYTTQSGNTVKSLSAWDDLSPEQQDQWINHINNQLQSGIPAAQLKAPKITKGKKSVSHFFSPDEPGIAPETTFAQPQPIGMENILQSQGQTQTDPTIALLKAKGYTDEEIRQAMQGR